MPNMNSPKSEDIFARFDKFTSQKIEEWGKSHELAMDYMDERFALASAYMFDGVERLEEKMFGKLQLIPGGELNSPAKSQLRLEQWQIVSEIGLYLFKHDATNWLAKTFNLRPGDPTLSKETHEMDSDLDRGITKVLSSRSSSEIAGLTPEAHRKWVYATAALTMYDEVSEKRGDMSEFRLEMRKFILDGNRITRNNPISAEILKTAQEVSQTKSRAELLDSLKHYVER